MSPLYATPEGTRRYAARFEEVDFLPFGRTDLLVSPVGFGSYRIEANKTAHYNALCHALTSGVNLIDTSSNYGDGGSEHLIGHTLGLILAGGQLQRDELIIVSKVGYLQGRNYEESQNRRAEGRTWPDLVEYSGRLEHCIHPEFIADQLTQTLERLHLETLDCYLLHNPEYYLGWAEHNELPIDVARANYYQRIALAFAYLEEEVQRGRIRSYGVSSNSFVEPMDRYQFTSASRLWEVAESISAEHHFTTIQFPLNIIEPGAIYERNQDDGQTLLEFAQAKKLAVLTNRPLNGVQDSTLIRFAEPPKMGMVDPITIEPMIASLIALETEFAQIYLPQLEQPSEFLEQLYHQLAAGRLLNERWFTMGSYPQWIQLLNSYLLPRLTNSIQFLSQPDLLSPEGTEWLKEYVDLTNQTLQSITAVYVQVMAGQSAEWKQKIAKIEPEWNAPTLSQMAIRAVRSAPGVTTVLVGMRQINYVEDVLEELHRPVTARLDGWHNLIQPTL